ncbi:hypothetical protein FFZ77_30915, partial [Streptomyces katsurahamanus]|nr:hypothetical protein [Streptomyces katsurahamanus]
MRTSALATLLLLWAVVLWRAPKAVRSPRQRPLTTAFAALAVVATLGRESVSTPLEELLGVSSAASLLKHLSGLVASAAVLEFIARMTGRTETRRTRRIRYGLCAAAGTTMSAVFPFVPRDGGNSTFLIESISAPLALVYWIVWLGYLGTALFLA